MPEVDTVTTYKWDKKYKIIVVDPPWPMSKIMRRSRPNQVGFDYPTMTVEAIMDFSFPSKIADNDAILFLWTTQRFLPDAFKVLSAWEFTYSHTLTWDKQNGLVLKGFHWRTEFVLVGYRGKGKIYMAGKSIPTIFTESSWRKHSVKPAIFYELVGKLGEPRIDIFARKRREDWDVWGNEVSNE